MADAIQSLLDAGFEPDGTTREETVRIPTRNSPLFGSSGGELAKLGGRQRFAIPGTTYKATVGKRTTAVYRTEGEGLGGVRGIASFDTHDIARLRTVIAELAIQSSASEKSVSDDETDVEAGKSTRHRMRI
jgi:hypothetical protein